MSDRVCVGCKSKLESKEHPFCPVCWPKMPKPLRAAYVAAKLKVDENKSNDKVRIERKMRAFIKSLWDLKAAASEMGL